MNTERRHARKLSFVTLITFCGYSLPVTAHVYWPVAQGNFFGLQDGTKDNPAVHVKRKGNDVVKRASELAVLDPQVSLTAPAYSLYSI